MGFTCWGHVAMLCGEIGAVLLIFRMCIKDMED